MTSLLSHLRQLIQIMFLNVLSFRNLETPVIVVDDVFVLIVVDVVADIVVVDGLVVLIVIDAVKVDSLLLPLSFDLSFLKTSKF